jgi:hypothetical protein
MRSVALFFGTLLVACLASPSASKADGSAWCAHYGFDLGGTNCGFASRAQCMASLTGNGGYCEPNAQYRGPVGDPAPRRPRRPG